MSQTNTTSKTISKDAINRLLKDVRQILKHPLTDNNIYYVGDRVGQIIILPYPQIEFEEVEELSTTERGEGGFGSSGV